MVVAPVGDTVVVAVAESVTVEGTFIVIAVASFLTFAFLQDLRPEMVSVTQNWTVPLALTEIAPVVAFMVAFAVSLEEYRRLVEALEGVTVVVAVALSVIVPGTFIEIEVAGAGDLVIETDLQSCKPESLSFVQIVTVPVALAFMTPVIELIVAFEVSLEV